MALQYKSTLPISALVVVLFGVYVSVAAELFLQLSALVRLSLTFLPPSIGLALALTAQLAAQFSVALGFGLPSFNVNFGLALQFELGIVLGLIAALEGIASGSLVAYAYLGDAADFGTTLNGAIGGGWPDGTPSTTSVTAYLFVATASGPHTSDQIASVQLVAPAATPPTPGPPSPPAGSYPPPPAYERGIASVSFPSQIAPTVVYPVTPATGTLTITDNPGTTGIGKITGVSMSTNGSGYPGPAYALISDTVTISSIAIASPIVLTLPNALSIPVGHGLGCTIAGVTGSTSIGAATNASPIVITVPSTTNLHTCTIVGGTQGMNGQWYCQALSSTTAALYADAAFTVPSSGTGPYSSGATLTGNINGLVTAKVLLGGLTVALYQDQGMTVPVVAYDSSYTGGTLSGGGTGQAARVTMGGGSQNGLKGFFVGLEWPTIGPAIKGGVTTISAMCAGAFELIAALLANLKARKGVLLAATASISLAILPPTINASIALLAKISANLSANLKINPPSFSAGISAQISVIADLVARINAQLGFGDVELEIWEYTGSGANFATAISEGPGSQGWHDGTPSSSVVAAGVFGLTTTAAAGAFGAFFGGL